MSHSGFSWLTQVTVPFSLFPSMASTTTTTPARIPSLLDRKTDDPTMTSVAVLRTPSNMEVMSSEFNLIPEAIVKAAWKSVKQLDATRKIVSFEKMARDGEYLAHTDAGTAVGVVVLDKHRVLDIIAEMSHVENALLLTPSALGKRDRTGDEAFFSELRHIRQHLHELDHSVHRMLHPFNQCEDSDKEEEEEKDASIAEPFILTGDQPMPPAEREQMEKAIKEMKETVSKVMNAYPTISSFTAKKKQKKT